MKILASYNIKGGVGKTAAAVNLAYLAARDGARTLLWDLDPQGAASFYLRAEGKVKKGVKGLISGKRELADAVRLTEYDRLDVIPADFSYRNMDLYLENAKKPERRLRKLLEPLSLDYDYAFLDCPPSISLVSESVFRAADALLVPTIPTTLSLRTLEQLLDFLGENDIADVTVLPFFAMVDRRKRLHQIITEHPPAKLAPIMKSQIPYSADIERMGERQAPLGSYAAASPSGLAYEALWREVRARATADEPWW
jgi:chromosome partitioning protein